MTPAPAQRALVRQEADPVYNTERQTKVAPRARGPKTTERRHQPVTFMSKQKARQWRADHLRLRLFTRLLARELGVDEIMVEMLSEAAPFHDVGKIRVPDAIRDKPGPLDKAEWEEMKRHTVYGADLLETLASLGYLEPEVLVMAKVVSHSHHEHWDGSGYPDKLKREAIPLPARIVSVIQAYDALRSLRPWRPAYDHAAAMRILLEGDERSRPSHFDPRVLETFSGISGLIEATYQVHIGDEESGR
jgi:putative two-component system response regulator